MSSDEITAETKHASILLLAVADAAVKWFDMRCPLSFSEREHLENASINTVGNAEALLATAVAEFIKAGGRNTP